MAGLDHLQHLGTTAGNTALTVQLGQDGLGGGLNLAPFRIGTRFAFVAESLLLELFHACISPSHPGSWLNHPWGSAS